jgi:hypothetical protein
MGSIIETDSPIWHPDSKRWYHSWSRDWITNEIFRRVHPEGYTMGEYIRKELNTKIDTGFILGAQDSDLSNMSTFKIEFPYIGN